MGHRIEPYVSIPTKLQTDSKGYTQESVIHIDCYSPLRILRTVKDSYRIRKNFRFISWFRQNNWMSERSSLRAWCSLRIGRICKVRSTRKRVFNTIVQPVLFRKIRANSKEIEGRRFVVRNWDRARIIRDESMQNFNCRLSWKSNNGNSYGFYRNPSQCEGFVMAVVIDAN